MALLEFLDDNDFENNKAPKQRNIDATGDFERQVFYYQNVDFIFIFCCLVTVYRRSLAALNYYDFKS